MKILAIESSAGPASCVVYEEGRVLAASSVHTGLTHSQTLVPMIHDMLKNAAIGLDAIDMLAVAAGPGSFTGVRIGVAAVKGLAFGGNKPCIGVSTLAAMARMTQGLPFDGVICAAMDARRQQVYTALFENHTENVKRITKDDALPLAELKKQLESIKKPIILIGDGAELCYNFFGSTISDIYLPPMSLRFQNAVGVALEAAAMPDRAVPADRLVPVYLRLSQAERELKSRGL